MDETTNNFKSPLIALLAVVAIVGVAVYFYKSFLGEEKIVEETAQEQDKAFYTAFLEKNKNFAEGESLLESKNYAEAVVQYEQALSSAEDSNEEGQLKYKIGLAHVLGNKPMEGIIVLKEVAGNETYSRRIRAYAVQTLGNMLYSYNTEEVRNEIFKGEPYEKFLRKAQGNQRIAERKLFEYASSFYPLGIPEMRIAKWYSSKIVRLFESGNDDADTKQKIEDAKSIIREKMENTDAYLLEIVNDEQERTYLAEVWRRKATVLGDLRYSGDTTFPDPEGAYKTALQFAILSSGGEASAKYSYAVFLATVYRDERIEDIQSLLSDFYTSNKYAQTGIVRMIQNEESGLSGNKDNILVLAMLDPRFAEYLKTLGWKL